MDQRNILDAALQQWNDARAHFSKAIHAYINAAELVESIFTLPVMTLLPEATDTIENIIQSVAYDKLDLHRAHAALKKKRNSYISPTHLLPSELLVSIFTTAVAPESSSDSSHECLRRNLSQVCSRWRQVALQFCPVWRQTSLTFGAYGTSIDEQVWAEIGLRDALDRHIRTPVHRPLGVRNTQHTQMILDAVAPYIKQLHIIKLTAEDVERLRPFLDFWLDEGVPKSIAEFDLSVNKAALVFPETNSRLGDRLSQWLMQVEYLRLCSVGLDWSTVTLNGLTTMSLSDLPSFCCPTLGQLKRMLSTCNNLRILRLERIVIPTSQDVTPSEPVELESLKNLFLEEVNAAMILSIISGGGFKLELVLRDIDDDTDMFESLRLFANRTSVYALTLKLSETRSEMGLTRLFHSVKSSFIGLKCLTLEDMQLRDSELNALVIHSLAQNCHTIHLASEGATGEHPKTGKLKLRYCTILTSPTVLHNAISHLPWARLTVTNCDHFLATPGEADGANNILELIRRKSEFGAQLLELMSDGVEIFSA
ncbi:hypothetical protein BDV93DRAFT_585252 [Ceratobasidium sp. AG-I]|nr:hypothetical protein BDV93DRAFT_585252 [Ceratobasidium sp. AG-I]